MSSEGYELNYIREAFDTNWIAPLGKNVDEFEREFALYTGSKNALALNSGTSALHLALKLAGISPNDKVFCQSLTFSATANAIIYENAIPVFIDSNHETWNMDPYYLQKAFEKYPTVKIVLVVHLYGLSANLDPILDICRRNNAILIEDAAESLGTYYKQKHTGTLSDYGIFSFNGNKIITTSGGGMLVSPNRSKIEKARFWSSQSRDKARHYQHSELGYNYRMSNILAGIGRGQLRVLNQRIAQKKQIFDFYTKELSHLPIEFMPINSWNSPSYWLSCITLRTIRPYQILDVLDQENIESRPLWKPMHLQPYFQSCDYFGSKTSEELFENGLCLPSDTKMTESDLQRITSIIKSLFK